jgi:glycosyltransferase involved in cell wall biosynthesis
MKATRRIKVLSLLDALHYGGDENRVLQLARSIDPDRFDFRIATLCPPDPEVDGRYGSLRVEFAAAGIPVTELGVTRTTRGLGLDDPRRHVRRVAMLASTVQRIVAHVRRERFDLIDGHAPSGYLCGTIAAVICGIPSVVTTYNVGEAWSPRIVYTAARQATLAAAGAIVTDSDAVANELQAWMLRKRHPRILVIPNGPPPPRATSADGEIRKQLGLPAKGTARIIGQVAGLFPGKGQHVLIDAAPAVLARHPDAFFLIVGFERSDFPGYTAELRSRAERLGISERVAIASYQGPIGDIWQTIDIHAHPTMRDSLPNAILESMSLGKPAVVASTAGIPTLVIDGETGIVVPPNDVAALATGLNRVLDDPELARRLGAAARRRYEGGYTEELLARRTEALFEELAAARTRA